MNAIQVGVVSLPISLTTHTTQQLMLSRNINPPSSKFKPFQQYIYIYIYVNVDGKACIYIPFMTWLPLMQISPAWFRGNEAPISQISAKILHQISKNEKKMEIEEWCIRERSVFYCGLWCMLCEEWPRRRFIDRCKALNRRTAADR